MAVKQKKSFFISLISVLSVCLNCLKISTANEMIPGVAPLRVFIPKNSSDMFNVDMPLRMNTSNHANSPMVENEIETENKIIYDELKGMQKNLHLKLPEVNEVYDNVYKGENESSFDSNNKEPLLLNFITKKFYGEDEALFESSVTNPVYDNVGKGEKESSFDSNNKPRLGLYFITKKPNGEDEFSSESSVTNPVYDNIGKGEKESSFDSNNKEPLLLNFITKKFYGEDEALFESSVTNTVDDNVGKGEKESSFDSNNKPRLGLYFITKKHNGEDEFSSQSSVTNPVFDNVDKGEDESSLDSNNKPRVGFYFFKIKPNGEGESSSESSVTNQDYEDCDNMTKTEKNSEIIQNIKNNSEDLPESESKNKKSTTTLTSNKFETSGIPEEAVKPLESEESEELETVQNQRQEPEKKSIITPTLGKEANQINLVIIIVTVSVSLILLLIILATIINHIRDRKHSDHLDIEKFQKENGREKTPMEDNHQDFYHWIKSRINPSHYKGQGQNSQFPENNDPHH